MHKRTRALLIKKAVKEKVLERDRGCCIFCGRPGLAEAHFISRAKGGRGIEENILTVCRECHFKLDNTSERKARLELARAYLNLHYPDFPDEKRIYNKERDG